MKTFYHFDSMRDMAQFNNTHASKVTGRCASVDGKLGFTGYMDFDQAMDTVINKGCRWDKGAVQVEKALIEGGAPLKRRAIKRSRRSYAGSRPHVAAFVAGSPRSMLVKNKSEHEQPVIKMLVPLSYLATVTEQQVYNFGAAVLAVVKELESQNKRVELTGIFNTSDGEGNHFTTTVTLKKASDQIGIGDIAYPVCHPSVYRRIGFGLIERSPSHKLTQNGYGKSEDSGHDITKDYDVVLQKIIDHPVYSDAAQTLGVVTHQVNLQLKEK